ncbi:MAG TPA: nucleotide sugar dehydrogenase [Pseudonocardia sp.]|jgi:UDP-N-acetyl-D-mannosaminuronic acid dehydrogenase/UDP-N-acetyl-D-glucosamine dehydrogenase|uniref:nucleotide sugar dehydrogenase n=1 Tax=Pseudonocardia sp. TaxID=60912 RepID=UPI002B4AAD88|nr:nucleotide sugar dehydrogenase [Pseudonocardia sp.]HLU58256.1 nucleotide sugar dehydrogenase [Pseudonocardia sp.]
MTVAVVGQGYVGLPLSVRAVQVGHDVVGFDLDKQRVDQLRRGESFIDDITDSDIAACLATGRFRPTDDTGDLAGFRTAVVCVPTPLRDGAPDLSFIEESASLLAPHLTKGATVVLESTTYPGTTEEVFGPILEAGSGLTAGTDFHLGYSPERIDPNNPTWHLQNTPKIVSGVDEASAAAVRAFYDTIVDHTVPAPGTREAEMAKLLENTFRHVNIALVNELAVYCHELGIDVWSVVDMAATKPFGFMKFTPGPGVGGHCLPIDPSYLSWRVRRSLGRTFRFVEIANDVNDNMPAYVAARVTEHLNRRKLAVNGSRVLLLGLTYKRNSGDARQSPAVPVAHRLADLGAQLTAIDPKVTAADVPAGVELVDCTPEALDAADVVVVLTDHDDIDWDLVERHAGKVLDTRNRLTAPGVDRL